jgi:uncharacterized protein (DUF2267 family)
MKRDEFLAHVQTRGALSSRVEAERWSTAVVRGLIQLLPEAELRRHFVTQLPGFLKSPLRAEAAPALLIERDAFVQHVAAALGVHATEGERALHTVYEVLKEALSAGQITEFEARIPKEIVAILERG